MCRPSFAEPGAEHRGKAPETLVRVLGGTILQKEVRTMTERNRFEHEAWWRFGTHNVMELPLHHSTIPHTINGALQGQDVVLWQEMSDDFAERVLRRHGNYRHLIAPGKFNDARISILKDLHFGPTGRIEFQTHHEGVSHERFITWADVTGFPGVPKIRCSSRHYWPGAFNPTRADRSMRHNEWMRGQGADFDFLADTANKVGVPQVAAGDYNRTGNFFPKRIGGYQVHHFGHGLDHMIFVDGEDFLWKFPKLARRREIVRNTESDHDVLIVKARLVKR
jgi:hypothetical protein